MSDSPLLDYIEQSLSRAMARAEAAAEHADRVEPDWREKALEAVRAHATRNPRFLAEHVNLPVPSGVTRRAAGVIIRRAATLGWIKADGYALDSTGAPKTCWRSLIYGGVSTKSGLRTSAGLATPSSPHRPSSPSSDSQGD